MARSATMTQSMRTLWLLIAFLLYRVLSCDVGWFGTKCQYKCHCTGSHCDPSGKCVENSKCEPGWFGASCQFVNVAKDAQFTSFSDDDEKYWPSDNNEDTCSQSLRVMIVKWKLQLVITWIRLIVNNTDKIDKFSVSVKPQLETDSSNINNDYISCAPESRHVVNLKIVDIFCQLNYSIHELMIEGPGIKSLCSIYVSGGRNLALKQSTSQSSTYFDGISINMSRSSNAVDGNTDDNYYHGSCIHTDHEMNTAGPTWRLNFAFPALLQGVMIYNRADCCQERLQHFKLMGLSPSGQIVFTFYDGLNDAQVKYPVIFVSPMKALYQLTVTAQRKTTFSAILNFCEIEAFGDWECPFGKYGIDCDKNCNCADKTKTCIVSTGTCPSGCNAGYQGEGCMEVCEQGTWGEGCSKLCDDRCANQSCDSVTGQCQNGCIDGYTLPNCTEVCSHGYWGNNCSNLCRGKCLTELCDPVTGLCYFDEESRSVQKNSTDTCPLSLGALSIFGLIVAFIFLIQTVIILALCCERRHKNSGYSMFSHMEDSFKLT
ncbi:multiple epidermal growth factor-like domains protein 11, partial [Biomphalaria pfeifferi]